jgi:hypothetical protein
MSSQHEHAPAFGENPNQELATPDGQLFEIVRGAYDEEGEGSVKPWNELPETQTFESRPLSEYEQHRQEAHLEALRDGGRHELQLVRDRFERRYTTWIPFSEAEMTLATTGLATKANKVLSKVSPNTLAITESYYRNAEGYRNQAALHHLNLIDARILEQDIKPSIDKIRETPEIKGALADYLQAKQHLERLKWRQRQGGRKTVGPMPRDIEYQEILDGIDRRSDEQLIAMWERAVQCAHSRRDFWQREIDNTESSNELVRAVKSEDLSRRT